MTTPRPERYFSTEWPERLKQYMEKVMFFFMGLAARGGNASIEEGPAGRGRW